MPSIKSVTNFLFITTQLAALFWVTVSYAIAVYATVRLGQPYPIAELSKQAIVTILGESVIKVVANIFEHNDGKILGTSHKNNTPDI